MTGNCFGQFAVGGGDEGDAAAGGFFPPQKIKNLLPIGKPGRVEFDSGGELALERGASRKQPQGQQQQLDGAGPEEDKDAFPKHVASDQSAVQIDAQNRRQHLGGFGSRDRPHGMIVA
jgi:hypothetical protein